MRRQTNYNTKHSKAILEYLETTKNLFVTAAQIADHLQEEQIAISRPTIYRQLEKLVAEGKIRKCSFHGISGFCFQYIDPEKFENAYYHLQCEICNKIFDLQCHEVNHVSRHIFEDHAFQVNDHKTVFYGRCKVCLQG